MALGMPLMSQKVSFWVLPSCPHQQDTFCAVQGCFNFWWLEAKFFGMFITLTQLKLKKDTNLNRRDKLLENDFPFCQNKSILLNIMRQPNELVVLGRLDRPLWSLLVLLLKRSCMQFVLNSNADRLRKSLTQNFVSCIRVRQNLHMGFYR